MNINFIMEEYIGIPLEKRLLAANKNLGQHFLINGNIIDEMLLYCQKNCFKLSDAKIIEVGPGLGMLTSALLRSQPRQLTLIERDQRFLPQLQRLCDQHSQVSSEIQIVDALAADACYYSGHIVANLPYNISTELLFKWLNIATIQSMTLMMQREVVQRIVARPRTKSYGWLSIICQTLCQVTMVYDNIKGDNFWPAPQVDSAIIHLRPKKSVPQQAVIDKMAQLCKTAFAKRRKIIRNSLVDKYSDLPWSDILQEIDSTCLMRPEEIAPEQWLQLANILLDSKL